MRRLSVVAITLLAFALSGCAANNSFRRSISVSYEHQGHAVSVSIAAPPPSHVYVVYPEKEKP